MRIKALCLSKTKWCDSILGSFDLVHLRSEKPCKLGNFSFIMFIVGFLRHPTFVSVKSYTIISTSLMSRVKVFQIFLFLLLFPLDVGHSIISSVYLPTNAFLLLVLYQCTFIDLINDMLSCNVTTFTTLLIQNWWPSRSLFVDVAINISTFSSCKLPCHLDLAGFGNPWTHINVSLLFMNQTITNQLRCWVWRFRTKRLLYRPCKWHLQGPCYLQHNFQ